MLVVGFFFTSTNATGPAQEPGISAAEIISTAHNLGIYSVRLKTYRQRETKCTSRDFCLLFLFVKCVVSMRHLYDFPLFLKQIPIKDDVSDDGASTYADGDSLVDPEDPPPEPDGVYPEVILSSGCYDSLLFSK